MYYDILLILLAIIIKVWKGIKDNIHYYILLLLLLCARKRISFHMLVGIERFYDQFTAIYILISCNLILNNLYVIKILCIK